MADEKVTVLLLTYNHRPYFEKAIESVLSQKTSFDFVIRVYDDASTDGTSDLVLQYAEKYPDKVKAFINKENQKGQHIFNALKQIQTPYFAMLETDDYWTDNTKLEQQFQIMEKHPDCSICGHNTRICYFDGSEDKLMFKNNEGIYFLETCKKLSQLPKVHISSRMLRTDALNDIDSFSPQMLLWDEPAFFFFLSKGNLYYIDNIMSVYNYSGKGLFSGSDKILKKILICV